MNFGYVKKWGKDTIVVAIIICLARLLPHPADFSPLWVLLCWVSSRWSWIAASAIILGTNFLGDSLLAITQGYPWEGSWGWFTYSALFIAIIGIPRKRVVRLRLALEVTVFYWLWTNWGVWYIGNFYAPSLQGLWQCYIAALPFLMNSVLGTGVWYLAMQQALLKTGAINSVLSEKQVLARE